MREMTASGDLTREVPDGGGWDDDDARVLATAFRSLTDALRRFQREAAQKERLSALGQLSTVVAHEVRNPLMIIKASLRALSRPGVTEAERADAAADIDQEVGRLERIVREILEYARPVSVALAPADLAAVCHDAAQAVGHDGAPVHVEADTGVGTVHTDAERLRRALVNLLTNARDAVGRGEAGAPASPIALRLSRQRSGGGERVVIEVADRGVGIAPEDLAHVFEPYFTTKRTGTGLGRAHTRNNVESLGGTIAAESRLGEGTTVRIELPAS
jgi:two-component system sensor histidine kinase HydH